MRIIFLDFDGVLNSTPFLSANLGKGWKSAGEAEALDPANVERLERLVRETAAAVVISSSWRHGRNLPSLCAILASRGFTGRVIGKTPDFVPNNDELSKRHCGERGDEIQAWLDRAPDFGHEITSFIILDDASDMAHLRDRLVQTDSDTGLTDEHVAIATKLLASPMPTLATPSAEMIARFTEQSKGAHEPR